MSKVVKKELGSFIKKLNKLKLADKIGTRGDVGEMQEEFISAIEEIDDAGKADKVDKEIIDICSTYFTCPKTEDCLKCPIREEDFEENPAEEQQAAMQDCWNDNSAKKDEIEKGEAEVKVAESFRFTAPKK